MAGEYVATAGQLDVHCGLGMRRAGTLKHIVHTSMVQYNPMPYAQRETCHEKIGRWPRQSPLSLEKWFFWLSLFFVAPCTHHQKIQYMEQTRPFAAWVYNTRHISWKEVIFIHNTRLDLLPPIGFRDCMVSYDIVLYNTVPHQTTYTIAGMVW